jgi:LysM repeat protein
MKSKRNFLILSVLTMFSFLVVCLAAPQPVQAQAGSAGEMLAEINSFRASNGLAPMEENTLLNLSAQNHADWIAETGIGSHYEDDGSDATDRAHAVGYTGTYVTENWARGPQLTVYDCIYVSWNDPAHMDNMLDPNRKEFGAGVAVDSNNFTVYVVNFSNFDTNNSQPEDTTDGTDNTQDTGPTATIEPLVQGVVTATPGPDGTIIHVVQYGQTLWGIADAYGIALADLLALNNLTEDSAIWPDEQLVIFQGTGETYTPTPTEIITEEPTLTPSPTQRPAQTEAAITPTPTPEPRNNFFTNIFSGDTLWIGIGLVVVSLFGIGLLLFTSSRLR